MRQRAVQKGLTGIHVAACVGADPYDKAIPEQLKNAEEAGLDSLTGYNYPLAGWKWRPRSPYADMVEGYESIRSSIASQATLPCKPVCKAGWDSRAWNGSGTNTVVRTGKSPELFEKMLRSAKKFAAIRSGPKVVMTEAWNELGEGDIIEPVSEFGFGYLDAIRRVFTHSPEPHFHGVPSPKELEQLQAARKASDDCWEFDFNDALSAWQAMFGVDNLRIGGGRLTFTSSTDDPGIGTGVANIQTHRYRVVEIIMKTDKGKKAQLFWGRDWQFCDAASASFPIVADGKRHSYRIELSRYPAWKSTAFHLRFDPTDSAGASVEIESIRFIGKP